MKKSCLFSAALILLLSACSQVPSVSTNNSFLTGASVANLNESFEEIQSNNSALVKREDVIVEKEAASQEGIVPLQESLEQIVSESSSSNETEEFAEIPKDYTIGEAHALTPKLEDAAKASPCYAYTWSGIDEYQKKNKLTVKKSVSFSYMGARLFKGWILSTLTLNDKQVLDTKTVQILVNNLQVTCVDEGNFTVDWEKFAER